MSDTLAVEQQQTPVFEYRQPPAKRRKFIRKRAASDDEDDSLSKPQSPNTSLPTSIGSSTDNLHPTDENDEGLGANVSSLAELARLRKKAARSRQGLQLAVPIAKAVEKKKDEDDATEEGMTDEKKEEERIKAEELARITGRFTQQTGQILDVDKHMMEYIEKKMSSKNASISASTHTTASNHLAATDSTSSAMNSRYISSSTISTTETTSRPSSNPDATSASTTTTTNPPTDSRFGSDVQMRGVTLGKLHEVDLGEETKMRNIARTEAATRRLEGKEPIQEEEESKGAKKKGRWKRRRRNSQDLQRDKLVEEVLKETRLELYDNEVEKEEEYVEDEGATDDRIVEKFRKEFLDAMNLKRGRRRPAATTKKDDKTKPRGPKLGGSRMARAAMREAQVGTTGKK